MIAARKLAEFTHIARMEFYEEGHHVWNVRIELESSSGTGARIVLRMEDVSELSLSEFGGGLTQLQCLRVIKATEGLDGKNYHIRDLENGLLSAECRRLWVSEDGPEIPIENW